MGWSVLFSARKRACNRSISAGTVAIWSRLSAQVLDQAKLGACNQLRSGRMHQNRRQVDPLQQGLGHRPLGVGEAERPDQLQRSRLVQKREQNGRLDGGPTGKQITGVVDHDRAIVDGSKSLKPRLPVKPGNGHLVGEKL